MDLASRFMNLFAGLDRAYGTYVVTSERSDGKRTGDAVTKKEPVTKELWSKHLAGEKGIGIVPIRDDCTAVFGAIDVDAYHDFDPSKVAAKSDSLSLPLVVCRSKSGGAHLYVFAASPVKASLMRQRLAEMAAMLGHGQCEIFPKQSRILAERGDVGGWINMPYFGGVRGARYCVEPGGNARSEEEFLAFAESKRQAKEFFDEPIVRGDGKDWIPDGPPCLQQLVEIGVAEGGRNEALFAFGIFAKKAFPDDWVKRVEEYNRMFFHPPLSPEEVTGSLRSLARKDYQYPCSKPPICLHCNSAVCRTRKHGVGDGGTTGGLPIMGQLRKLNVDPPIWFWEIDSTPIELTTEQLQNPRQFQRRCMEMMNRMPSLPSNDVWQRIVGEALESVNVIEMPKDSSTSGQFWDHLEKFCTGRAQARSKDEMLNGKPWTDEEGVTWFRMSDVIAYLERQHFRDFKPNKIAAMLHDSGATHQFLKIKSRGFNVWGVPKFQTPDSPLEAPESVKEGSPF
jgi:hypothetical protein